MNKEKRKALIILLMVFAILLLILLLISSKIKNKQPEVKPPVNVVEERNEKVNDYQEFFRIQATINDIDNVGMNTSYTIKELYINGDNSNNYYFIRANEFIDMKYNSDVYLMLILDNDSKEYELVEIDDSISSLEEYAKNYNIQAKNINNGSKLLSASSSIENVLTIYIDYFKKMLLSNNKEAYSMLAEDTKAKYLSYEDFNNKTLDIYNQLTSKTFSYSEGEKSEDGITYYLEDDNRNKIVIYEESIMNFKISY